MVLSRSGHGGGTGPCHTAGRLEPRQEGRFHTGSPVAGPKAGLTGASWWAPCMVLSCPGLPTPLPTPSRLTQPRPSLALVVALGHTQSHR